MASETPKKSLAEKYLYEGGELGGYHHRKTEDLTEERGRGLGLDLTFTGF